VTAQKMVFFIGATNRPDILDQVRDMFTQLAITFASVNHTRFCQSLLALPLLPTTHSLFTAPIFWIRYVIFSRM
jgi:hypothetical protein